MCVVYFPIATVSGPSQQECVAEQKYLLQETVTMNEEGLGSPVTWGLQLVLIRYGLYHLPLLGPTLEYVDL